jgi:pimeloyl-ACP methyl ester carboxylesterase
MTPGSFDFAGQRICIAVGGDGPPILLVHGTPFSSHVWHRIAPALACHHRVHCFDLLSYGQSEKRPGQDVSLGVQNRLLSALLDHWRLERADIVGHDFGGATVLRTHLLDGRDFRSITLIDPVAMSPWGSPFVQHVRDHEAAFAGLPDYIHRAILPVYIRGAIHREISDSELAPYIEPWLGAVGQPAFYRQIAQMDRRYTDEIEPLFGAVRAPTQILWGEEDRWIPIEHGEALQRLVPGSRLVRVPRAGHLVQEDAPQAIVAALTEFLPLG